MSSGRGISMPINITKIFSCAATLKRSELEFEGDGKLRTSERGRAGGHE